MTNPHTLHALYNRIRAIEDVLRGFRHFDGFVCNDYDFLAADIRVIAIAHKDIILYTRHELTESHDGDPMVEIRIVVRNNAPIEKLAELQHIFSQGLSDWPFQVLSFVRTEKEQKSVKSPGWEPLTARDEAERSPESAAPAQHNTSSEGASE